MSQRFGVAVAVPTVLWAALFPSLSHGIAAVLLGTGAFFIWEVVHGEHPVRTMGLLALTIGLGQMGQNFLGFGLEPWSPLFGLGTLAVALISAVQDKQQPWLHAVTWRSRRFAHAVSTPLHVIQFCAEQWAEGKASDQHAAKLLESAHKASALVQTYRSDLTAWVGQGPVAFRQVWEWVTDELEGVDVFQLDPDLAEVPWRPEWIAQAGQTLRQHVSSLIQTHQKQQIIVKQGKKGPILRFFKFEDIANSEKSMEGGACEPISQWRMAW